MSSNQRGTRKEDENMAVNLEAIRRRVAELSGNRRNSSVQLWKPDVGEYKIRGLPWKSTPDGIPFIERRFYYIGNNSGIVAPSQFGKPDPINDLIRKLYSSGSPDDRALAKKLQSKMRAYMPIIVRGQEDKGVQVWSFGKMVYQSLLGLFTDEDCGDFLDPLEGFDLKVTLAMSPKKVDGRSFMDTTVKNRPKSSMLSEDSEQAKKWLDSVPNIDDMYKLKSAAEIEEILNTWLAGGAASDAKDSGDEGSGRGNKPKDELDKLADELKVEAPKAEPVKSPKKKKADVEDLDSAPKQSLDDAFNELMKEESGD